jgi:hypothetical protein
MGRLKVWWRDTTTVTETTYTSISDKIRHCLLFREPIVIKIHSPVNDDYNGGDGWEWYGIRDGWLDVFSSNHMEPLGSVGSCGPAFGK